MRRSTFLVWMLVRAVLGDEDWGYFYGPSIDPKHWYLEYQQCGGRRQSPINIDLKQTFIDRDIKPIIFVNYDEIFKNLKMINDGHTIKLEVPVNEPNPPIIDHPYFVGFHYYLLQCHFHWNEHHKSGSEHTIDGQSFSMEMHCVHQKTNLTAEDRMKEASMLVLSVLFQLAETDNPDLTDVIGNLQSISNETGEFTTIESWRFDELLPKKREGFYSYNGSLTTPPCSEIVRWIILSEPVPISRQQLDHFHNIKHKVKYQMGKVNATIFEAVDNDRPLQPSYGRRIRWHPANKASSLRSAHILIIFVYCIYKLL